MDPKELEELTALITKQVLARMQPGAEPACDEGKRKLLVVGKPDRVPKEVRNGAVIFTIEDYTSCQNILRYDAVYISKLTLTQLADAATGRTESPEACALVHALLENVPVSMGEDALPHRKYKGKQNAALYHLYENYLQTLQIFGVKLLKPSPVHEQAPATPPKFSAPPAVLPETHGVCNRERLVTETMARELSTGGEVHLRTDAIVTPAAKDVFTERGVLVLRDQ
jgi:hypothetical protein